VLHLTVLKSSTPYRREAHSFLEEDGTLRIIFIFHWRSPRRYLLMAKSTFIISSLVSGQSFCLCIVVSAADFVLPDKLSETRAFC